MMYRNSARLLLAALIGGVAACADSTAPAGLTESMLTRDVASDAADATAQDLAEMAGAEALSGLPLASSPMSSTSAVGNCTWSVAAQMFQCPDITTPDGLTLSRVFAFYDNGMPQQAYDAQATDSIVLGAWIKGTLTSATRTAWLKHGRLMVLGGLSGTETQRTWHGEGSRDDSAHVNTDNVARTTHFMSEDKFNDIVYKLPRAEFPFPQSGTITHDVQVSATTTNGSMATTRSATRHVVVAFNGTRTASVTVGTTACTLDLVTRKINCN